MNVKRHSPSSSVFKWIILALWGMAIVGAYLFLHAHHIPFQRLPNLIRQEMIGAGTLGPLLFIASYVTSALLFLPKSGLDILGGAVYGPVFGSMLVLLSLNLTGIVVFCAGRFFGRHMIAKREQGWIKKYDDLLREEGFVTVLVMRLFLFPFDLVSAGCGLTEMSFRQYVLGTFFGSLPSTITLAVLGGSLAHPRSRAVFVILLVLSFILALVVRRLPWVHKKLYKKEPLPTIK